MDDARGALLPLATGFRLRAMKIKCSCGVMCWRGRGMCDQKSTDGAFFHEKVACLDCIRM